MKNASDVAALKAISQNLMHSNLSVTDGIYGILSEIDIRKEIAALRTKTTIQIHQEEELLAHLVKKLISQLRS